MKNKPIFEIFTCRHYTELASKELDQKLSLKEQVIFLLHHIICTFCRRSRRQFFVIDRALKSKLHSACANEKEDDFEFIASERLTKESKARITKNLNEVL
jgi:hypothetical protein